MTVAFDTSVFIETIIPCSLWPIIRARSSRRLSNDSTRWSTGDAPAGAVWEMLVELGHENSIDWLLVGRGTDDLQGWRLPAHSHRT